LSRGRRSADDPIEAPARTDEPAHVTHRVPDITAVRRDDVLVTALAARRADPEMAPDMTEVTAAADDDAIRLLRALITDVDAGAPALPAGPPPGSPAAGAGSRPRRRRRTGAFVSLGVAALMLTSTGVAAAGGGIGAGGGVISRFAHPADERPHRESRAGPRRANEAADGRARETARTAPEETRRRQSAPRRPRAAGADDETGRVEPRPRSIAPPAPPVVPPSWFSPSGEPPPRVPEPGDEPEESPDSGPRAPWGMWGVVPPREGPGR
jgi:hypothetical protein